eukprot:gene31874-39376_t
MLVKLVEKPLLDVVMTQSGQNQSRAAEWLGLNRNTLRKKLWRGLLPPNALESLPEPFSPAPP